VPLYQAPKRYVATSAVALALAILSLLVVIAVRSTVIPEAAADAVDIKVKLRESLSP
jgi:predicted ferric reductase